MKLLSATTLALMLASTSALAAGLGEPFQIVGPWHVLKNKDPMTDEISCMALYNNNIDLQLTDTSFAISLRGRGGLYQYQFRIDDLPANELTLASEIEKQMSVVFFDGENLKTLLRAKRLRFQADTSLSTLVYEDIDFSQAQSAVNVLTGPGCRT